VKKYFLVITIAMFPFFVFPKLVYGQIVINEVLNNPSGSEVGAEWVELYNVSDQPVSLKDCILRLDDSAENQKVNFADEDFIDRFKVISWDYSWLNNSGDQITIECGLFSDTVIYGKIDGSNVDAPSEGLSFGRNPDGTGNFNILSTLTMGEQNSDPPTNTPNPTNTQVPTVKLTQTGKQTPTLKPDNTATMTNAPKPSNALTQAVGAMITSEVIGTERVLAETVEEIPEEKLMTQAPKILSGKSKKNNLPMFAVVLIVIGVLFIIISIYPILVKFKKGYNFKNGK
jgi:hypothetical protein